MAGDSVDGCTWSDAVMCDSSYCISLQPFGTFVWCSLLVVEHKVILVHNFRQIKLFKVIILIQKKLYNISTCLPTHQLMIKWLIVKIFKQESSFTSDCIKKSMGNQKLTIVKSKSFV